MANSMIYRVQQKQLLNNTLGGFSFEQFEIEKQVLDNMNKIELMECLGLKDITGKLIHFGDILLDEAAKTLLTPVIEIANDEHTLYFKPLKSLNSKFPIGCKSTHSRELKVVGNLYNNSELFAALKEQNKFINLVISTTVENHNTTIHIKLSKTAYS